MLEGLICALTETSSKMQILELLQCDKLLSEDFKEISERKEKCSNEYEQLKAMINDFTQSNNLVGDSHKCSVDLEQNAQENNGFLSYQINEDVSTLGEELLEETSNNDDNGDTQHSFPVIENLKADQYSSQMLHNGKDLSKLSTDINTDNEILDEAYEKVDQNNVLELLACGEDQETKVFISTEEPEMYEEPEISTDKCKSSNSEMLTTIKEVVLLKKPSVERSEKAILTNTIILPTMSESVEATSVEMMPFGNDINVNRKKCDKQPVVEDMSIEIILQDDLQSPEIVDLNVQPTEDVQESLPSEVNTTDSNQHNSVLIEERNNKLCACVQEYANIEKDLTHFDEFPLDEQLWQFKDIKKDKLQLDNIVTSCQNDPICEMPTENLVEALQYSQKLDSLIPQTEEFLKQKIKRKTSYVAKLDNAFELIASIEEKYFQPVDMGLEERIESVNVLLKQLNSADDEVAKILEEGGISFSLPLIDQDQLSRQFTMFHDKYVDFTSTLKSQLAFLENKMQLKKIYEVDCIALQNRIDFLVKTSKSGEVLRKQLIQVTKNSLADLEIAASLFLSVDQEKERVKITDNISNMYKTLECVWQKHYDIKGYNISQNSQEISEEALTFSQEAILLDIAEEPIETSSPIRKSQSTSLLSDGIFSNESNTEEPLIKEDKNEDEETADEEDLKDSILEKDLIEQIPKNVSSNLNKGETFETLTFPKKLKDEAVSDIVENPAIYGTVVHDYQDKTIEAEAKVKESNDTEAKVKELDVAEAELEEPDEAKSQVEACDVTTAKVEETDVSESKVAESKKEKVDKAGANIDKNIKVEAKVKEADIAESKEEIANVPDATIKEPLAKHSVEYVPTAETEEAGTTDGTVEENGVAGTKAEYPHGSKAKEKEAEVDEIEKIDLAHVPKVMVEEVLVSKSNVPEVKVESSAIFEAEDLEIDIAEAKVQEPDVAESKLEEIVVARGKVEEADKVRHHGDEAVQGEAKEERARVDQVIVEQAGDGKVEIEKDDFGEAELQDAYVAEPEAEEDDKVKANVKAGDVKAKTETVVSKIGLKEVVVAEAKIEKVEKNVAQETNADNLEEIVDSKSKTKEVGTTDGRVEEADVSETKAEVPYGNEVKATEAEVAESKVEETNILEAKIEKDVAGNVEVPSVAELMMDGAKMNRAKAMAQESVSKANFSEAMVKRTPVPECKDVETNIAEVQESDVAESKVEEIVLPVAKKDGAGTTEVAVTEAGIADTEAKEPYDREVKEKEAESNRKELEKVAELKVEENVGPEAKVVAEDVNSEELVVDSMLDKVKVEEGEQADVNLKETKVELDVPEAKIKNVVDSEANVLKANVEIITVAKAKDDHSVEKNVIKETKTPDNGCEEIDKTEATNEYTNTVKDTRDTIISLLEGAVSTLNEFEKFEDSWKEYDSIDSIMDALAKLEVNRAHKDLMTCELLVLSLQDELSVEERQELCDEIYSLQNCLNDAGEDINRRSFDFQKLKILLADYEEELSKLAQQLTLFRESNVAQTMKASLYDIKRQLKCDKSKLNVFGQDLARLKSNRDAIGEDLPTCLNEEFSEMEIELNEELNGVIGQLEKEEMYVDSLSKSKKSISHLIAKFTASIENIQDRLQEVKPENKINVEDEVKKLIQEYQKLAEAWKIKKPEIKTAAMTLPQEDVIEIKESKDQFELLLKNIVEDFKEYSTLHNFSSEINQKLDNWFEEFNNIKHRATESEMKKLVDQIACNENLLVKIEQAVIELGNIFKKLESIEELSSAGSEDFKDAKKEKLRIEAFQENVKELWIYLRERMNHLKELKSLLDNSKSLLLQLDAKLNAMSESCQGLSYVDFDSEISTLSDEYAILITNYGGIKHELPAQDCEEMEKLLEVTASKINTMKTENLIQTDDSFTLRLKGVETYLENFIPATLKDGESIEITKCELQQQNIDLQHLCDEVTYFIDENDNTIGQYAQDIINKLHLAQAVVKTSLKDLEILHYIILFVKNDIEDLQLNVSKMLQSKGEMNSMQKAENYLATCKENVKQFKKTYDTKKMQVADLVNRLPTTDSHTLNAVADTCADTLENCEKFLNNEENKYDLLSKELSMFHTNQNYIKSWLRICQKAVVCKNQNVPLIENWLDESNALESDFIEQKVYIGQLKSLYSKMESSLPYKEKTNANEICMQLDENYTGILHMFKIVKKELLKRIALRDEYISMLEISFRCVDELEKEVSSNFDPIDKYSDAILKLEFDVEKLTKSLEELHSGIPPVEWSTYSAKLQEKIRVLQDIKETLKQHSLSVESQNKKKQIVDLSLAAMVSQLKERREFTEDIVNGTEIPESLSPLLSELNHEIAQWNVNLLKIKNDVAKPDQLSLAMECEELIKQQKSSIDEIATKVKRTENFDMEIKNLKNVYNVLADSMNSNDVICDTQRKLRKLLHQIEIVESNANAAVMFERDKDRVLNILLDLSRNAKMLDTSLQNMVQANKSSTLNEIVIIEDQLSLIEAEISELFTHLEKDINICESIDGELNLIEQAAKDFKEIKNRAIELINNSYKILAVNDSDEHNVYDSLEVNVTSVQERITECEVHLLKMLDEKMKTSQHIDEITMDIEEMYINLHEIEEKFVDCWSAQSLQDILQNVTSIFAEIKELSERKQSVMNEMKMLKEDLTEHQQKSIEHDLALLPVKVEEYLNNYGLKKETLSSLEDSIKSFNERDISDVSLEIRQLETNLPLTPYDIAELKFVKKQLSHNLGLIGKYTRTLGSLLDVFDPNEKDKLLAVTDMKNLFQQISESQLYIENLIGTLDSYEEELSKNEDPVIQLEKELHEACELLKRKQDESIVESNNNLICEAVKCSDDVDVQQDDSVSATEPTLEDLSLAKNTVNTNKDRETYEELEEEIKDIANDTDCRVLEKPHDDINLSNLHNQPVEITDISPINEEVKKQYNSPLQHPRNQLHGDLANQMEIATTDGDSLPSNSISSPSKSAKTTDYPHNSFADEMTVNSQFSFGEPLEEVPLEDVPPDQVVSFSLKWFKDEEGMANQNTSFLQREHINDSTIESNDSPLYLHSITPDLIRHQSNSPLELIEEGENTTQNKTETPNAKRVIDLDYTDSFEDSLSSSKSSVSFHKNEQSLQPVNGFDINEVKDEMQDPLSKESVDSFKGGKDEVVAGSEILNDAINVHGEEKHSNSILYDQKQFVDLDYTDSFETSSPSTARSMSFDELDEPFTLSVTLENEQDSTSASLEQLKLLGDIIQTKSEPNTFETTHVFQGKELHSIQPNKFESSDPCNTVSSKGLDRPVIMLEDLFCIPLIEEKIPGSESKTCQQRNSGFEFTSSEITNAAKADSYQSNSFNFESIDKNTGEIYSGHDVVNEVTLENKILEKDVELIDLDMLKSNPVMNEEIEKNIKPMEDDNDDEANSFEERKMSSNDDEEEEEEEEEETSTLFLSSDKTILHILENEAQQMRLPETDLALIDLELLDVAGTTATVPTTNYEEEKVQWGNADVNLTKFDVKGKLKFDEEDMENPNNEVIVEELSVDVHLDNECGKQKDDSGTDFTERQEPEFKDAISLESTTEIPNEIYSREEEDSSDSLNISTASDIQYELDKSDAEEKLQEIENLMGTFFEKIDAMKVQVDTPSKEKILEPCVSSSNQENQVVDTAVTKKKDSEYIELMKLKEEFRQAKISLDSLQFKNEELIKDETELKQSIEQGRVALDSIREVMTLTEQNRGAGMEQLEDNITNLKTKHEKLLKLQSSLHHHPSMCFDQYSQIIEVLNKDITAILQQANTYESYSVNKQHEFYGELNEITTTLEEMKRKVDSKDMKNFSFVNVQSDLIDVKQDLVALQDMKDRLRSVKAQSMDISSSDADSKFRQEVCEVKDDVENLIHTVQERVDALATKDIGGAESQQELSNVNTSEKDHEIDESSAQPASNETSQDGNANDSSSFDPDINCAKVLEFQSLGLSGEQVVQENEQESLQVKTEETSNEDEKDHEKVFPIEMVEEEPIAESSQTSSKHIEQNSHATIEELDRIYQSVRTIDSSIIDDEDINSKLQQLKNLESQLLFMYQTLHDEKTKLHNNDDKLLQKVKNVLNEKKQQLEQVQNEFHTFVQVKAHFNELIKDFVDVVENKDKLKELIEVKDKIITAIETIDTQQAILMEHVQQDGHQAIFDQLDEVQDTYLDVFYRFSERITEAVASCLTGTTLAEITYKELQKAFKVYQDLKTVKEKDLDSMKELKDMIEQYTLDAEKSYTTAEGLSDYVSNDEVSSKAYHVWGLYKKLKRDLENAEGNFLLTKEAFIKAVQKLDNGVQELYNLESIGKLTFADIEKRQQRLDHLVGVSSYHTLPDHVQKTIFVNRLNLDNFAMKVFKRIFVPESIEENNVDDEEITEKPLLSETEDVLFPSTHVQQTTLSVLRPLALDAIEKVLKFSPTTTIRSEQRINIDESKEQKQLVAEDNIREFKLKPVECDLAIIDLEEFTLDEPEASTPVKPDGKESFPIEVNQISAVAAPVEHGIIDSKVEIKKPTPLLKALSSSRELLNTENNESEGRVSSVASIISESSGVYSADAEDKSYHKLNLRGDIHQGNVIPFERDDEEQSSSTLVDDIHNQGMKNSDSDATAQFATNDNTRPEAQNPYNSPNLSRRQFVENWAASIHNNTHTDHLDLDDDCVSHVAAKTIVEPHGENQQKQFHVNQIKPSVQIDKNIPKQEQVMAVSDEEISKWMSTIVSGDERYVVNTPDDEEVLLTPSNSRDVILISNLSPSKVDVTDGDTADEQKDDDVIASDWASVDIKDVSRTRVLNVELIPAELIDSTFSDDVLANDPLHNFADKMPLKIEQVDGDSIVQRLALETLKVTISPIVFNNPDYSNKSRVTECEYIETRLSTSSPELDISLSNLEELNSDGTVAITDQVSVEEVKINSKHPTEVDKEQHPTQVNLNSTEVRQPTDLNEATQDNNKSVEKPEDAFQQHEAETLQQNFDTSSNPFVAKGDLLDGDYPELLNAESDCLFTTTKDYVTETVPSPGCKLVDNFPLLRTPESSVENSVSGSERPSLFSELTVAEDQRVKDIAFKETADKLYAALLPNQSSLHKVCEEGLTNSSSMNTSELNFESNALASYAVLPRSSTPVVAKRVENPEEVTFSHDLTKIDFSSQKEPNEEPKKENDASTVEIDQCLVQRESTTSYSDYVLVKPDLSEEPSAQQQQHLDDSTLTSVTNTQQGLINVLEVDISSTGNDMRSPMAGKLDETLSTQASPSESYHHTMNIGLEQFIDKLQGCMESMVEITELVSQDKQKETVHDTKLSDKMGLLSQLGSQQSQIDSLNMLGQQIQEDANDEITSKVQEKLRIMNTNWDYLQQKALGETTPAWDTSFIIDTNERTISPVFSPIRPRSPDSDEEQMTLKNSQQQSHLKYQILFSDLFDWLSSCDTSLSRPIPSCISLDIIKTRLFATEDIAVEVCLHLTQLKSLEDAWSNLADVNSSLIEQQDGIMLLWKYITDKVVHVSKKWCKVAKVFAEKPENDGVATHEISAWLESLKKEIEKTSQLVSLVERRNGQSEQAVISHLRGLCINYKTVKLLSLLTVDEDINDIEEVWRALYDLQREAATKFDSLTEESFSSSDSSDENEDEMNSSPVTPRILKKVKPTKVAYKLPLDKRSFFRVELQKFSAYVNEEENDFNERSAGGIPTSGDVVNKHLSILQSVGQNIKAGQLPIKFLYQRLNIQSDDVSEEFNTVMEASETLYNNIMSQLQSLTRVHLLLVSLQSRKVHILSWLDKMNNRILPSVMEREEDELEKILLKQMKLADVEKRFSDKTKYKNHTLTDARKLLLIANNADVQAFVELLEKSWLQLQKKLKTSRCHLEEISSVWKEFRIASEKLKQWLSMTLISLHANLEHCNIDSVKMEQHFIETIEEQLSQKHHQKERLEAIRETILQLVNNSPCESIELQMTNIKNLWQELKSAVYDRKKHLSNLNTQVEWSNICDMMSVASVVVSGGEVLLEECTNTTIFNVDELAKQIECVLTMSNKLDKHQSTLQVLLQHADDVKWYNNHEFQRSLAMLHSSYNWLMKNLPEKVNVLQAVELKVKEMTLMIEDSEDQLNEIDTALNRCVKLNSLEDVESCQNKIKISSNALSSLDEVVKNIKQGTEALSLDTITSNLDVIELSKSLQTHIDRTQKNLSSLQSKLHGYDAYRDIENELGYLQDYALTCQETVNECLDVSLTRENLVHINNTMKAYQKEIPYKTEHLEKLYELINTLTGDECLVSVALPWLEVTHDLSKKFSKLTLTVTRKQEEVETLSTSVAQFDEDYNELKAWLHDKEMEYSQLSQQAKDACSDDSLNLINKCKKLRDDLPVFVTFSDSMASLLSSKSRLLFYKDALVRVKLEELKERYESLKEQINHLYDRLIASKGEEASYKSLFETTEMWLKKVADEEETGQFTSIQDKRDYLKDTLEKTESLQVRFNDIISNSNETEFTTLSGLMNQLEVLVSMSHQNIREVDLLMNDVDIFNDSVLELNNKIHVSCEMLKEETYGDVNNALKQDEEDQIRNGLDELKLLSDKILYDKHITNNVATQVESSMSKLETGWSQLMTLFKQQQNINRNDLDKFYKHSTKLVDWIKETKIKLKNLDEKIKYSSVETLKRCFTQIMELKDEICTEKENYHELQMFSNTLIKGRHSSSDKIQKVVIDVEVSWTEIEVMALENVDQLKNILYRWADYTDAIKDMMSWLRDVEVQVKQPLYQSSERGLEKKLLQFQNISLEFDARRTTLENVKSHVAYLSRVSAQDEQMLLQHQLLALSQLWSGVNDELKVRTQTLSQLMELIQRFSHKMSILTTWLSGIETSLFSDKMISSPEKQKERIRQIYGNDMKRYDTIRNELKSMAVEVLSHGASATYGDHVREELNAVNYRWRILCDKLGMTYKIAEETLFLLKLLEEMLKQLTSWLNNARGRLKQVRLESCSVNEMALAVQNLEVLIIEFNNRDQDFVSVSELCSIVQQSPDACPFVDDLTKLLDSSEAFKTRWTETHNKSRMFKAYIENRIAIYKEWKNDLRLLDTWLEINEKVCNSNKTFFSTVARNFDEEFEIATKALERILKSAGHLTKSNLCVDSCNISQNTEDIKARFNAITRAYHNSKVLDEKPTLSFEEIESKVENWLTDVEVKMISLQPYACEETIERQVAFLKELNSEIKQNFDLLESLNTVYQQTSPTGVVRQGIVEELNDRYQQVLDNSSSWILDLTMPHSPTR